MKKGKFDIKVEGTGERYYSEYEAVVVKLHSIKK